MGEKAMSVSEGSQAGPYESRPIAKPVRQFNSWKKLAGEFGGLGYDEASARALKSALKCGWETALEIARAARQAGWSDADLSTLATGTQVDLEGIRSMLQLGLVQSDLGKVDIAKVRTLNALGMTPAHYQDIKASAVDLDELKKAAEQKFSFDYLVNTLKGTGKYPTWGQHLKMVETFGVALCLQNPQNLFELLSYQIGKDNLIPVLTNYLEAPKLLEVCQTIQDPTLCKSLVVSSPALEQEQAYWDELHTHRVLLSALLKRIKVRDYLACREKGHLAPQILECCTDYDEAFCVSVLSSAGPLNTVGCSTWLHAHVNAVKPLLASGGNWIPCVLQMAAFDFSDQRIAHMMLFEEEKTQIGDNVSVKFHTSDLSMRFGHFAQRHTFKHFVFANAAAQNSMWPASFINTEHQLRDFANAIVAQNSSEHKGYQVHKIQGVWDDGPAITQFYPTNGPDGIVVYSLAEMQQFKTVIDLKPAKK